MDALLGDIGRTVSFGGHPEETAKCRTGIVDPFPTLGPNEKRAQKDRSLGAEIGAHQLDGGGLTLSAPAHQSHEAKAASGFCVENSAILCSPRSVSLLIQRPVRRSQTSTIPPQFVYLHRSLLNRSTFINWANRVARPFNALYGYADRGDIFVR